MKPTRLFWNGKRLKDIYVGATRFEILKFKVRRLFRKVVLVSIAITLLYGAVRIGAVIFPNVVSAVQEKQVFVDSPAPIMERIAKCESHGKHYDKNGQVLLRSNTNKSVDVGKYQINSVWFAKATELGLDVTKEEDNEKMAMWLYKNRGTEDWYSSKACWK